MDAIRTFLGIDVNREVRRRADTLIGKLRRSEANVKWVAPEHMHYTLKFLGDVPSVETPKICRAVAEAAQSFDPFMVDCRGLGAFPDVARARTVWLGAGEGGDMMEKVFLAVDDAVHSIGYPAEPRRFHPHLTLGRVRRGGPTQQKLIELMKSYADFAAGEFLVKEVIVYASYLDKGGPTYEVMGRGKLGGA